MVIKTDIDYMLDESGFGAATEMGGFTLEMPRSILVNITFLEIHIHFINIDGAAAKISVSNIFFSSGSLNTNPPTLLLLPLQYLHIHFSAFLNAWVQCQEGGGGGENKRKIL